MQAKSWVMLKVLLNHFHGGSSDALLHDLPQEEIQQILIQEVEGQDYQAALVQPAEILKKIHYSWILPAVLKFPVDMQPLVLKALPPLQEAGLLRILKKEASSKALTSSAQAYLLQDLYSKMQIQEILPLAFLPQSHLTSLAMFSKNELVELMNLLGIHDLAEEIRRIVDKQSIKNILQLLTPNEQQYLKVCLRQKEKLSVPKLGIDHWKGSREKIEGLLHRRGMMRFGKALIGQHPHFLWHITHVLDSGRGSIVAKYAAQSEASAISTALIQQVIAVMNFLKPENKA